MLKPVQLPGDQQPSAPFIGFHLSHAEWASINPMLPNKPPGIPTRVYADFSNNSRPISMRRISLVPAPIS
jgi:hypothetical protein